MSWHCSLELVEAFSQAKVWVTGSCVRWKKIRIAERSLCGGKKTTASQSSQSGTTLTPSTGTPGMALSMSFLLDFHAKDSPLQESKKEQTTPEINGQRLPESSEKYAQAELFSKTSRESESTSESWPEILPIWGMIQGGELFPLEKPEPRILESVGGAWPTPTVNTRPNEGSVRLLRKQVLEGKLSEEEATQMLNNKSPFSAQGAVEAWPTPSVTDSGGGIARDTEVSSSGSFSRKNKDGVRWGVPLRDAVPAHEKKWPTPTATERSGTNPNTGRGAGLWKVVKDISWPTPNAHEPRLGYQDRSKGKKGTQKSLTTIVVDDNGGPVKGTRLNPDWVEWLMGWPIGWTSLDFINLDMKRWWNYSMITEPAKYWEDDPADIPVGEKYHTPRLTSKKEYRADRLRCCGNGQVPQQVILAMKILS